MVWQASPRHNIQLFHLKTPTQYILCLNKLRRACRFREESFRTMHLTFMMLRNGRMLGLVQAKAKLESLMVQVFEPAHILRHQKQLRPLGV